MQKPLKLTSRKIIGGGILALFAICLLLAGVSAIINGSPSPYQVTGDRLTDADKARVAEAIRLRKSLGEQIIPGFGKADIPAIIYNEQYAFLIGIQNPSTGWKKIPQHSQNGSAWEPVPGDTFDGQPYFRQRLLNPEANPQSFTVLIGDRYAASLGVLDWMKSSLVTGLRAQTPAIARPVVPYFLAVSLFFPSSDVYIAALDHESMHAYQGMRAPKTLDAAEQVAAKAASRYPYEDKVFVADWQKELDLLRQAIQAKSDSEVRDLARQFLEQRANRRVNAHLDAEQINFERLKEWEEGIAKYAEISAHRLGGTTSGYQPAAETSKDTEFKAYTGFQQKWDQEVRQISLEASAEKDGRFYYTGFAQAALLDRLNPGWKDRLFDEGVWLEDLLSETIK